MENTLTTALIDRLALAGVRVEPGEMLRIYGALAVGGRWRPERFVNVVAAILAIDETSERRVREVVRAWLDSAEAKALWVEEQPAVAPATADDPREPQAEEPLGTAGEEGDTTHTETAPSVAPPPTFGPGSQRVEAQRSLFWLVAPDPKGSLLYQTPDREQIAWGVQYHQLERPSRHLDLERTIDATIEQGGMPTLRWRPRVSLQPVSLWLDTGIAGELGQRLVTELSQTLEDVGVTVQRLRYWQLPDKLKDERNRPLPAAELVARPGETVVLIITDGRGLRRRSPAAIRRVFRDLACWGQVAVVHVGPRRLRQELEGWLTPHGLPCLAPAEIPAWLGSSGAERASGAAGDSGPIWLWAAACALMPLIVNGVDALALLSRLRLPVSPFALAALRDNSVSTNGIQFTRAQNRRLLERARAAFAHPVGEHPAFLKEAARYWMERVRSGAPAGWRQDSSGAGISRRILYATVQLHVERAAALTELARLVGTPEFGEYAEYLRGLRLVGEDQSGMDLPFRREDLLDAEREAFASVAGVAGVAGVAAVEEDRDYDEPLRLPIQQRAVNAVLWSPDGRQLFTAGDDGSVRAWDVGEGTERWRFEGGSRVRALALDAERGELLAGDGRGRIHGIDPASGGAEERQRSGRRVTIWQIEAARGRVASVGTDGILSVEDADGGDPIDQIVVSTDKLFGVAIRSHPEFDDIAVCGAGGVLGSWKEDTGLVTRRVPGDPWTVCWGAGGGEVFVGLDDGSVALWKHASDEPIVLGAVAGGRISCLRASPGGELLASSMDGSAHLLSWDGVRLIVEASLQVSRAGVLWSEMSADGTSIATADTQGRVVIWPRSAFSPVGRTVEAPEEVARPLKVQVVYGDMRYARWPIVAGISNASGPLQGELATLNGLLNGQLRELQRRAALPVRLGQHLMVKGPEKGRPAALLVGAGAQGFVTASAIGESLTSAFLAYLLEAASGDTSAEIGVSCLLIGAEHDLPLESLVGQTLKAAMAASQRAPGAGHIAALEFIQQHEDRASQVLQAAQRYASDDSRLVVASEVVVESGGRGESRAARRVDRLSVRLRGDPVALEYQLRTPSGDTSYRQPVALDELNEALEHAVREPVINRRALERLERMVLPGPLRSRWLQDEPLQLLLTGQTAGIPWELLGGSEPLAARAMVTRQMSVPHVAPSRQILENRALILADLESEAPLPGARREGLEVASLFDGVGWQTEAVIGHEHSAVEVRASMTAPAARVWHIAASGRRLQTGDEMVSVIGLPGGRDASGRPRNMLTGESLASLDVAPELVLLNACDTGHLGALRRTTERSFGTDMVTALLSAGVRGVVVVGWLVDDRLAVTFGRAFWRAILSRQPLGEAALSARLACLEERPGDTTFAAYQVYGDPWMRLHRLEQPVSLPLTDEQVALLEGAVADFLAAEKPGSIGRLLSARVDTEIPAFQSPRAQVEWVVQGAVQDAGPWEYILLVRQLGVYLDSVELPALAQQLEADPERWIPYAPGPSSEPTKPAKPVEPATEAERSNALVKLILSLFSDAELRRFVDFLPDGQRLSPRLPGRGVPLNTLGVGFVELLNKEEYDMTVLFEGLYSERPGRSADIDTVRALWGDLTKQPVSLTLTGEQVALLESVVVRYLGAEPPPMRVNELLGARSNAVLPAFATPEGRAGWVVREVVQDEDARRFVRLVQKLGSLLDDAELPALAQQLEADPNRWSPYEPPNKLKALVDLLISLFSDAELRRFIQYLPDGPRLSAELPAPTAPIYTLAYEFVELLNKQEYDMAVVFEGLYSERPRRGGDIDAVRALWGEFAAKSVSLPFTDEHVVALERAVGDFLAAEKPGSIGRLLSARVDTEIPAFQSPRAQVRWVVQGAVQDAGPWEYIHLIRQLAGYLNSVELPALAEQLEADPEGWIPYAPGPSSEPAKPATKVEGSRALMNLILSLFSDAELRRFIQYLPDGPRLSSRLPGPGVPLNTLAYEFVELLNKQEYDMAVVFEGLYSERPGRSGDIDAVRALWGEFTSKPVSLPLTDEQVILLESAVVRYLGAEPPPMRVNELLGERTNAVLPVFATPEGRAGWVVREVVQDEESRRFVSLVQKLGSLLEGGELAVLAEQLDVNPGRWIPYEPSTKSKSLAELLISLFSDAELRRFIQYLPDGQRLSVLVPGPSVPLYTLAYEFVELLNKEEYDMVVLFEGLYSERPGRSADIDTVRALWGEPAASRSEPQPRYPLVFRGGRPLVDREGFKALLDQLRDPSGPVGILVSGPSGSGKTYLGAYCAWLGSHLEELKVVTLDLGTYLRASDSLLAINETIAARFGLSDPAEVEENTPAERRAVDLSRWLLRSLPETEVPSLLVVGGLEAVELPSSVVEYLYALAQELDEQPRSHARLRLVVIGGEAQLFFPEGAKIIRYELEPITERDITDWLQGRFPDTPAEDCARAAKQIITQAPESGGKRLGVINRLLIAVSDSWERPPS